MADQLKLRGGTEAQSENFTGAAREVTVDTTLNTLRVHDGVTPGGHKLLKAGDCLVVEENDPCNPNAETCKVTVNGELEAESINVENDLQVGGDTLFEGDIQVEGNIYGGNTRTTALVNGPIPGKDWSRGAVSAGTMGGVIQARNGKDIHGDNHRCVISGWPEMSSQEDANIWLTHALYDLDEAFCELKEKDADDIPLHSQEPAEGCGGPGCCISGAPELLTVEDKLNWLQKAIYELENCFCNEKQVQDHYLDDHLDVSLGSPSEGDYFVYKNGKWTNESKCLYECHSYIQNLASL